MADVTRMLMAIQRGDLKAADELLPVVYDELRHLAAQRLSREPPGQTLQSTALVHEAYLRLVGSGVDGWENRRHFFAAAAEAMRRILVDRARQKNAVKHGGGRQRIDLQASAVVTDDPSEDLLDLNEALDRLAALDARKADVVKLRYFAGMTLPDAARALGISTATAERYWAFARGWLRLAISGKQAGSER